jgi:tetratricopeptide (TPR) repeat protein
LHLPHPFRATLLLLALVLGGACSTPSFRISHTRPAQVQLGKARLGVEALPDGQKPNAEQVVGAVVSVAQGQLLNKWVAVKPVQLGFEGALRAAEFDVVEPRAAELMVRATPVSWAYDGPVLPHKDQKPGSGQLRVRVEIVDLRQGGKPLYTATYRATGEAKTELAAMESAAHRAGRVFLRDLTPTRITNEVLLDDSDERVKPAVKLVRQGKFEAAYAALTDMSRRWPDSAAAHYNLALLCESRAEYEASEKLLNRALRLQQKPMYYEAQARMRKSRADWDALHAPPLE